MFFPKKKIFTKNKYNNWINDIVISSSMKLKDFYHIQLKFPVFKDFYNYSKQKHAELCKFITKNYYQEKIYNSAKSVWNIVKELSNKKSTEKSYQIQINEKCIDNELEISNNFNNFFPQCPS